MVGFHCFDQNSQIMKTDFSKMNLKNSNISLWGSNMLMYCIAVLLVESSSKVHTMHCIEILQQMHGAYSKSQCLYLRFIKRLTKTFSSGPARILSSITNFTNTWTSRYKHESCYWVCSRFIVHRWNWFWSLV